uniref:SLX9 ribosome biosis factor n=1 Tax=Meleagris gallopavo TaxID=9103 RepID=A0A803Y3P0_MELGA
MKGTCRSLLECIVTPSRIVQSLTILFLMNAAGDDWDFSSSDIFSGLTIDPDSLVKKLDLDSRSIVSSKTGLEGKTLLSKKEKMKLRKERWLQKIESVKLAKRKQKAEAKRKATPVVGDMQPLMEALPELSDLTAGIKGRKPSKRYVSLSNGLCYFPSSCKLKHPPAQTVATSYTSLGCVL